MILQIWTQNKLGGPGRSTPGTPKRKILKEPFTHRILVCMIYQNLHGWLTFMVFVSVNLRISHETYPLSWFRGILKSQQKTSVFLQKKMPKSNERSKPSKVPMETLCRLGDASARWFFFAILRQSHAASPKIVGKDWSRIHGWQGLAASFIECFREQWDSQNMFYFVPHLWWESTRAHSSLQCRTFCYKIWGMVRNHELPAVKLTADKDAMLMGKSSSAPTFQALC